MAVTNARTGGGVSQRHTGCDCEQAHSAGCAGRRCRCPREHGTKCAHRIRPDGKTACGCPWAYAASAVRAGKRVQATGSGYRSRSAALRARAEAVETLRRAPAAAKRGDTLEAWLNSWLDRRTTGSNALRSSTEAEYRRLVAIIIEAIGGERLRDVTPDTLDDLERHLHKKLPKRATTHARVFAVLQSALRDAYRRGAIMDDPTRRRDAVRAPKTRRTMLQPEQFGRLIAWMDARGERMSAVFWVAATTGLRRGELAGLRWIDVDLHTARIIVAQQAVQVGREVIVGAPKTAAGEGRVVMLDARTVEVLRGVQEQQAADARAWGSEYGNDAALVFANEDGSPLVPEQLTRALPRMIRIFNDERRVHALDAVADADELDGLARSHAWGAARLARVRLDRTLEGDALPPVVFHSLRHLSASLMLASGRSLAAVQRRLGHSSISITSDLYGHSIDAAAQADAEAAAALIPTRPRSTASADETTRSRTLS